MLNLYQKIQKIESIQAEADKATYSFKNRYHIDCIEHCSKCCRFEGVNATPLEFFPLAWHFYKTGQLESILEKLTIYKNNQCVFCIQNDDKWGCSVYPTRGLICRLFGFSSVEDKFGNACFAACHTLKENYPELISNISNMVFKSRKSPIISQFYRKLAMIDLKTGEELVPINQAIKEACEIIYLHTAYK